MSRPRVRQRTRAAAAAWGLTTVWGAAAAQAAAAEGGFNPGDLGHAIIAIAVFLILLLVLGKYGWGPIIAQLRSREDRIGQSVSLAEKRRKQAEALLAEYQAQMQGAGEQADRLLAAARGQAAEHQEALLAEGRREAEAALTYAKQQIDMARDEAMRDMREMTARMAVELAGRVLRRDLTAEDQDRLLRDAMDDIARHVSEDA